MEVNQQDNEGENSPDMQNSRDVEKIIDRGPSNEDCISTSSGSGSGPSTPETLMMSGIATLQMQSAFHSPHALILQRALQASRGTSPFSSALSSPGSSGLSTPGSSGLSTPTMQASPASLALQHVPSTSIMPASSANLALMSSPTTPTSVEEEDKWGHRFYEVRKTPEISKYAAPSLSTAVTSMSRLDISAPDDVENRCKQLEAKIELLRQVLEGPKFKRYNGNSRYSRRRALGRQRSKVKGELAKVWKELIVLKQESERNQHKRWSVNEEVQNLFSVALRLSYPEFKDEESKVVFSIREYGEYHCEDVLKIWPRLRKECEAHLGPRRVGWQIKKNLQAQQSEMIQEGLPWVFDIGIVTISLSGKWMAKSLHRLLRDGVGTWAPPLFIKNYLVKIYFPACDVADLSDMDLLRRDVIKETLVNLLEYCKVDWCSTPCGMDLPQEESDKFRTTFDDEDVLIFPNGEGQHEPLIHAKIDSSVPMEDLNNLWYGLEKESANWIVCLTRAQQQEYIKMCFTAARHAKWLPSDPKDVPRSSYTGYESCNISMEDMVAKMEELISFSGKLEAEVSKAGYTIEEVVKCAVRYTILKNHRLAVCTFSFEDILNEEGHTFVYVLNTRVRNQSFMKKHHKDISEITKASELTLGESEIWEDGEERRLVLHLLEFTQVIALSCYPVLPHKLCDYLYNLCVRFNGYCDSWEREVGIADTKLLLCKATELIMDICFQILGVTPKKSSYLGNKQESFGLPKSLLQVGRLNHEDPHKKLNSRFQLFTVYIHITRDPTVRECMLFGKITISDTYGVLYDGWGLPEAPDRGTVYLFHCDPEDQIRVTNHQELDLGDLSSSHLVPLSSSMEISTELYATTLKEDALFPLSRLYVDMKFADFWKLESDTQCDMLSLESDEGDVRMYYVLLKDAVDCAIEVRYKFKEDREVHAEVYAFYGSDFFDKNEDPFVKNYYTLSLYEGHIAGKVGELPLKRSMVAVPANGSVVIKARLHDYDSEHHGYLDKAVTFDAQPRDGCEKEMLGSCGCCSFSVRVVWSKGVY